MLSDWLNFLKELSRGKEAALEQERNRLQMLHKKVRIFLLRLIFIVITATLLC
jgi:hypothetical protein